MRLYTRADFLKLPAGTIFSHPSNVDLLNGLYVKASGPEDGYTNDWVEQDLIGEPGFPEGIEDGNDAWQHQMNLRDTFQEFRTDLQCGGRNGLFDDNDKFVVWDDEDVLKLQLALQNRFIDYR